MAEKNKIEENFYTKNLLHFYNVPLIHDKLKNFQKNRSVEEQSMYLKNILKLSDEDNENYLEELKNYEYEVIVETLYRTFAKDKYSISLEKFKELAVYLIEDSINEANTSYETLWSLINDKIKKQYNKINEKKLDFYKKYINSAGIIKIINELTGMNKNDLYINNDINDTIIKDTIEKYLDKFKIKFYDNELKEINKILFQEQEQEQEQQDTQRVTDYPNLFNFIKETVKMIHEKNSASE